MRAARGELVARGTRKRDRGGCFAAPDELPSPPWKQSARERVLAEQQAVQQRKDERVARGQKAREERERGPRYDADDVWRFLRAAALRLLRNLR